jgi:hypothetical protein
MCFLSFCGLNTEPEPEPKLVKSRNWNRNLSKVGSAALGSRSLLNLGASLKH